MIIPSLATSTFMYEQLTLSFHFIQVYYKHVLPMFARVMVE